MGRSTDRERLFHLQAHAFEHLLEYAPPFRIAMCPLCLGVFGDGDVHGCAEHRPTVGIEHAPPRQRTRLGRPRGICLTHIGCQGAIGYESEAGRYRHDLDRLRRGEEVTIRGVIDGQPAPVVLRRDKGVVRPVRVPTLAQTVGVPLTLPVASQLTELKAAYLIAFTALGYIWATDPALDPVRLAIKSGDPSALGSIPLFKNSESDPASANLVVVDSHADRVAVIGDDPAWGVLLPLRKPFRLGPSERACSMREADGLPWLPDEWWRRPGESGFRWDCTEATPRWRVEVDQSA